MADDLIQNLMDANNSALNTYEKIHEEKNKDHKLQIFMKSYVTEKNHRVNIIRAQYILPCTPLQFMDFMNNTEEQMKIDTSCEAFREVEKIQEDYSIIYLAYKKVLVASPRDLIYLKHVTTLKNNNEQLIYCDVSRSIEHDQYPQYKDKVRGNIILSGNIVQSMQMPEKLNQNYCLVRLYSENDLKTNVPVFLAKSFTISSMKNYIDKCWNRLSEIS